MSFSHSSQPQKKPHYNFSSFKLAQKGAMKNKIKILGLYFGARKCGFQIPAIVPLMSEFV